MMVDIRGYEGLYMICRNGDVVSLPKVSVHKNGRVYSLPEKVLKPYNKPGKYPHINLFKDKKAKTFEVHRLVAEHFIPNPQNKREVNHINGIKTDNRVENLEWMSSKENKIHGWQNGLYKPGHQGRGKMKMIANGLL
jgi:hypothetical protein